MLFRSTWFSGETLVKDFSSSFLKLESSISYLVRRFSAHWDIPPNIRNQQSARVCPIPLEGKSVRFLVALLTESGIKLIKDFGASSDILSPTFIVYLTVSTVCNNSIA